MVAQGLKVICVINLIIIDHSRMIQAFIEVFHWSRPAGNYAFLESRDQCLHGQLGSFVVSRPVGESR